MDKNLALETLKSFVENTDNVIAKDAILTLHPELAESEDERVRKALLHCCDDWEKGQFSCFSKEDVSAIRAYLEKQKEQKPLSTEETELNSIAFLEQLGYTCIPPGAEQKPVTLDEDVELGLDRALYIVKDAKGNLPAYQTDDGFYECDSAIRTLENLLKNGIEQKPAEWSDNFEENIRQLLHDKLTWHSEDGSMSSTVLIDDKTLKDIISGIWFYIGKEALKYPNKELNVIEWSEEDEIYLQDALWCVKQASKVAKGENDMGACWSAKRWLKSLRPQPHWKPSEEQMRALENVIKCEVSAGLHVRAEIIQSLLNDLKKL